MPKSTPDGNATTQPDASAARKSVAKKSAVRNTASAPARPGNDAPDALAMKANDAQTLAAAMPFNAIKPAEFGRDNAVNPPEGQHTPPPSVTVGGSTLSEANGSAKTGSGQSPQSVSPGNDPLDRVRTDATGQALTTNHGTKIADNQNSLKAGLRGPALLEDFILREKITHFDHERIPERIVHARGSAAHGFFECYKPLTDLTAAAPFAEAGKQTPVFLRFSTVAGERGSVDTARDVRGFAVKFYTDAGNWDLVGNNIPVFFIQDAMKFPDLVHAVKPEPHNAIPQAASAHDTFWDFVSLSPESTHMLLWVMSDRSLPRSYRMMQGFGVHTFRLVNAEGQSTFVKFHWTPKLGTHSLVWDEAAKIAGADADFHRRDLWEAIEAGEYPEWELGFQLFSEEQADAFSFDVLDATKIVPEELVPVTPVGRMVLNRNPDNFFAETEQVAFATHHLIPGIDFSNDPLLQGRNHSYLDTQLTRLGGPNFHEIPINASVAKVFNNQRDGIHRQAIHRGRVAYEPNSLAGGCPFQGGAVNGFKSFPQPIHDDKVRGKPEKFADHYTQATLFYDSQTDVEKAHIVGGFRFELSKLTVPAVRERMLAGLANVSADLAQRVADGLGLDVPAPLPKALATPLTPEVTVSSKLSLKAFPGDGGIRTRKVAILVADGVDGDAVASLQAALLEAGAVPRVVGLRIGAVKTVSGEPLQADASMENSPAVLFDAMALPGGDAAVTRLAASGQAAEFIQNQYRHCKPLLAVGDAAAGLLQAQGIDGTLPSGEADPGVLLFDAADAAAAPFIAAIALHRHPQRETDPPVV